MEIELDNLRARYDLIVIGTGPAGLTLAHKCEALTGRKTLLIESGNLSGAASDAQKLARVDATGDLGSEHYSVHSQRIFGGTSTVWEGWCAVLEKRSFLNGEWPLAYDELYAFYPEAHAASPGLHRSQSPSPRTLRRQVRSERQGFHATVHLLRLPEPIPTRAPKAASVRSLVSMQTTHKNFHPKRISMYFSCNLLFLLNLWGGGGVAILRLRSLTPSTV